MLNKVAVAENPEIEVEPNISITFWKNLYEWRMRRYFYVHVFIFIFDSLLGGVGIFIIENYIKPNRLMSVSYVDAWFVAPSYVCSCGLMTFDFVRLSTQSKILLMILTISSGITLCTLPVFIIKAQTHERDRRVDDDHSGISSRRESEKSAECPIEAGIEIARLPTARQLRYRIYLYFH